MCWSRDFTVLRAEADEQAVEVPFDVVGQLAEVEASTPFAAGLELLARWSGAQDARPLVVVVEDLHWADPRSREALCTAGRRLGRDRVLVVVTSRPDPTPDGWERLRGDQRRCKAVAVGALSVDEVAAVCAGGGRALPRWAIERLHRHSRGHALYVRTLLAELDDEQLSRVEGDLPAPRTLASTTVARLAALPADAQALALGLAVLGRPVALALAGRVAGLAHPSAALDRLLESGLVTWRAGEAGSAIGFVHPLYRAAVYADLSATRRQALHRAAADAVGPGEALTHRVAAAEGPDAALAGELAAAAAGEPRRAVSARYLLSAAAVTPDPRQGEQYLLDGVWLLLAEGQLVRAAGLRDRVAACAATPKRELVLGSLDWEAGRAEPAEAALRRAARDEDPGVVVAALSALGQVYFTLGRGDEAMATAARLLALPALPAPDERAAWIFAAVGEMFVRGAAAGLARLAARLPQPPDQVPSGDADLLITRGALGFYAGRARAAIADLRAGIRLGRRTGTAQGLPRAHLQLAQLLVAAGDWDQARLHARLGVSLVDDERLVWIRAQAHAVMGRLCACRGEWEAAEHHIGSAEATAESYGTSEAVFTARIARATLARARQDPDGVIAALAPLVDPGRPLPMSTSLGWWPMMIFAVLDRGDVAGARAQVDRLHAAADERGIDMRAQVTGLHALLALGAGDPDTAVDGLRRGTELAGPDVPVLDRAELHHRCGRLLVARGRRRDGVGELRRAAALLAGAEPFLRRIESDLVAAGMRGSGSESRRGPRLPLELTERERDVVALGAG
jgi:tetratricopeptide (TPR) repeat protein